MDSMKHTRDPIMGIDSSIAIWHADSRMEALVVDLFEKLHPIAFIETGTHMGWTAHWIAARYPETTIHTVEIKPEYYHFSGENLAEFKNVRRTLGDSRDFLRKLPGSTEPVIFWLDAHFYPDHPLREECEIVSKYQGPHVVLIDDYYCGADFPGDLSEVPMVESALGKDYWRPNYPYETGFSGYVLFVKGVDYRPPGTMRRNGP
jgi:hypothetical protein